MDYESEIGRWSWKYALVKFITKVAFYLFYRKICVSGQENIPDDGRLIFAANHQNALMDPLAILLTCKYQPVFLARADIFRRPLIARILKFFKIIPVYRFKDGVDSMGQNEDTFKKTTKILTEGGCIGIMPEGNHGSYKRLRLLKKGIFRIVFRAEEVNNNSLDVKIIPVGLDYSNIHYVFEELTVNYGEPLTVSGYFNLYKQHPQKGINAIKKDLAESLKSLMIDVKDEVYYEQDKLLLDIGSKELRRRMMRISGKTFSKFSLERAFCQAMYEYFEHNPENADELRSKSSKLAEIMRAYNFSPGSIDKLKNPHSFFLILRSIFCFPVFITGFLFHIIPYLIIRLVLKKLKDPQFISSFKFTLGLLLLPLNYIFLAVLFYAYFSLLVTVLIIFAIPLTGILAYSCNRQSRQSRNIFHIRWLCRKDKRVADHVEDLNSKIIEGLETVYLGAEFKLK